MHCQKCSQPLHLTGPHACPITRGNAVPEVDLLREEVYHLGRMLDLQNDQAELTESLKVENARLRKVVEAAGKLIESGIMNIPLDYKVVFALLPLKEALREYDKGGQGVKDEE